MACGHFCVPRRRPARWVRVLQTGIVQTGSAAATGSTLGVRAGFRRGRGPRLHGRVSALLALCCNRAISARTALRLPQALCRDLHTSTKRPAQLSAPLRVKNKVHSEGCLLGLASADELGVVHNTRIAIWRAARGPPPTGPSSLLALQQPRRSRDALCGRRACASACRRWRP